MAGASQPIVAGVGTAAMTSEPAHIRLTESVSPALRPCLSAYTPITQAPIGRMTKPTAKIAAVFRSWVVRSPAGKKTGAK